MRFASMTWMTKYGRVPLLLPVRLLSEVPLGAFLSGGIDSSVIVALMSDLTDQPVKTFSIGFKEAEYSELGYARQVAKACGTDHREFIVTADMADVLPKLAWHYSEPFADSSALPSYYVARETRKFVTVALNSRTEIEVDGLAGIVDAVALVAFELGAARGDVAWNEVAESGVALFEVIVTVGGGDILGLLAALADGFDIFFLAGHPDAAVITQ